MIGVAQVGNRCVSEIPLGEVDVVSVTLHQAPPGTNGQYPALGPRPLPMQGGTVGEIVPLGARRHAPGSHGETALPAHLDDDEINHRANHILKHKAGPLLAVSGSKSESSKESRMPMSSASSSICLPP